MYSLCSEGHRLPLATCPAVWEAVEPFLLEDKPASITQPLRSHLDRHSLDVAGEEERSTPQIDTPAGVSRARFTQCRLVALPGPHEPKRHP